MSENNPNMEAYKDISSPGEMATSDIPALKGAAKEVMENISSEVNVKDGDANVMVNGGLQNGGGEDEQVIENGKDYEESSHVEINDTEEVKPNKNTFSLVISSLSHKWSVGNEHTCLCSPLGM